jgi:hypothetical protein
MDEVFGTGGAGYDGAGGGAGYVGAGGGAGYDGAGCGGRCRGGCRRGRCVAVFGRVTRSTVSLKGFFLMALFTESQFLSTAFDVPEGASTPAHQNDAVTLHMSDGTVSVVFDKLTTGLRLLAFMRTNSQWNVWASDDVVVVSINAVKGLVLESSLTNQKLITSYLPILLGGEVRWASRTTSLVLSTTDALKSVGFCHKLELPFSNNLNLRIAGAHMQLFDWNYEASPPNGSTGSMLADPTPLRYDFTPAP